MEQAVTTASTAPETGKSQLALAMRRFARNRAAVISLIFIVVLVLSSVFAPVLTPYDYAAQDLRSALEMPSREHWLGTDNLGRDIFTRILYGGRVSLLVSLMAVLMSTSVALVLGSIAGYYGGRVDTVIMRFMDVLGAIPGLLLAMTVSAALGGGLVNTAIAISISGIALLVRQLRSSIMLLKNQEFVEASKAFGASNFSIIVRHVIPNTFAPLIVQITLSIGSNIIAISGLSFLGVGVRPPTPEWGNMVAAGQEFITTHWPMITFPGLIIMLTMLAFNLMGDGLRDAMDPRMKR